MRGSVMKKTKLIGLRVTAQEHKRIAAGARRQGQTITEFVKQSLTALNTKVVDGLKRQD